MSECSLKGTITTSIDLKGTLGATWVDEYKVATEEEIKALFTESEDKQHE